MAYLPTLDVMIEEQDRSGRRPAASALAALLAGTDDEKRVGALLYQACDFLRAGQAEAALAALLSARKLFGFTPLPVIANIIWLCGKLGREQSAAHECLQFAHDAGNSGYDNLALEAASAAFILDTLGAFEIIRDPRATLNAARLYDQIALRNCPPAVVPAAGNPAPLNIAMIVPNLVDHIVAYTQMVLHFARYADKSKFKFWVYCTENFSVRKAPMFPFGAEKYITEKTGAVSIRELRSLNVPVYLAPRDTGFIEAAHNVAAKMLADCVDIAIFQGGLSTPIDWLTARWTKAPVKIAIHTGISLMTPGLDLTLFDNPANIERENAYWPANAGQREVMPKAVDVDDLIRQPPFERRQFGIPADAAVVFGTLSNALHKRLSTVYMETIGRVLQRNPQVWFLAFGSDPIPEKMRFFESMRVAERVRFGGRQSQVGSALKTLDIYASEFPVGGAQSVMESMICGVPVVALWWSNAHAESAGAQVVGPEFAVPEPNREAYAVLLEKWIADPAARHAAACRQKQRAESRFSAAQYVRTVCERGASILSGKQGAK